MAGLDDLKPDRLAITDAGIETVLIFHGGWDLPAFASFPLLDTDAGRSALVDYYSDFVTLSADRGVNLVLETPTWRANPDWAAAVGYDDDALRRIQHDAVALVLSAASPSDNVIVSGSIGPRGDGYVPGSMMSVDEAADYHGTQVHDLAAAGAAVVTSATLTYADEGVGIAAAASAEGIPAVIGFTVEVDGRLPSGETLADAVDRVDAITANYPAWYLINCAHPDHILPGLTSGSWLERIGAIRCNASRQTHAQLDAATELDAGDPRELADGYLRLRDRLPGLRVVGGCCGTDIRHISAIADALL